MRRLMNNYIIMSFYNNFRKGIYRSNACNKTYQCLFYLTMTIVDECHQPTEKMFLH